MNNILWCDAHADFNTFEISDYGNQNDNIFNAITYHKNEK